MLSDTNRSYPALVIRNSIETDGIIKILNWNDTIVINDINIDINIHIYITCGDGISELFDKCYFSDIYRHVCGAIDANKFQSETNKLKTVQSETNKLIIDKCKLSSDDAIAHVKKYIDLNDNIDEYNLFVNTRNVKSAKIIQ